MAKRKNPQGRPPKPMPERIHDTPQNIVKLAVKTRSKEERDLIKRKAAAGTV